MKSMIIKGILLGGVTSLMLSCNTGQGTVDKDQIKQALQAKEDSFAAVFNGDVLQRIGYYADDATSFLQNTAPLVGKEAIIAFLESDLAGNTNKISFKTNEVFPSSDGNMVVEIGSFKVVDSANNPVNSGNYMTMFQKRDGRYVAVRDMSTSDGVLVK
jgi:ketosteroid isomerase-like protein